MRPLLFLLSTAAVATGPASAPPVTHAILDLPQDRGAQQVIVQERAFAAGTESGWHVHPGTEVAWVVSGQLDLVTAAGVRRLGRGDSFIMPRGVAHNGINRSTTAAQVAITLIIDQGAAPRQSVTAPK